MPISGPALVPPLLPGLVDVLGELVRELRADEPLLGFLGAPKVWAVETPAKFQGKDLPADPRHYVLLRRLAVGRMQRVPVASERIAAMCYGKTPQLAAVLYGLVSNALHNQGPRIGPTGIAIYRSYEEVGGQPTTDPVTGWPFELAIFVVFAAAQAVI